MAKPTSDAAPARAVCKETEQVADAAGGSPFQEGAKDPDATASVQRHGSQPAECGVQQSPANEEVPHEQKQEQSSQTTWDGGAKAEGVVVHSTSDSSNMDALVPDAQSVQSETSSTATDVDSISTATGALLQERTGSVHGKALPASMDAGKDRRLPRKGSCIVDRGLNTVEIKSSRQTGDILPALSPNKQVSRVWVGA